MQHLDDSVNKYEDGVLDLPILFIEQLVAHLAACKDMEVFKAIHAVYFRWLVWVFLSDFYPEFVVSTLEVTVLFSLEDYGPFTVVRETVGLGQDYGSDGGLDFFLVLLLEGLQGVVVLVLETFGAQV